MIDAMDGMSEKDSLRERRLSDLRNQSNLQLLEQIRMNSQMMQLRLDQMLKKEQNIYMLLAKERDRNLMYQRELTKYESKEMS